MVERHGILKVEDRHIDLSKIVSIKELFDKSCPSFSIEFQLRESPIDIYPKPDQIIELKEYHSQKDFDLFLEKCTEENRRWLAEKRLFNYVLSAWKEYKEKYT